jgi:hypothetical protein
VSRETRDERRDEELRDIRKIRKVVELRETENTTLDRCMHLHKSRAGHQRPRASFQEH